MKFEIKDNEDLKAFGFFDNESEEYMSLLGKWETTGLLEDLNDKDKYKFLIILDNQARCLLKEETYISLDSDEQSKYNLDITLLLRKVFDELNKLDKVHIYPMKLPSGLVFRMSKEEEVVAMPAIANSRMLASGFSAEELVNELKTEFQETLSYSPPGHSLYFCPYVMLIKLPPTSDERDRFMIRYAKQVVHDNEVLHY